MEKYGFVYIWFDINRTMYYIGCHWGHEDDGYICSSPRMLRAHRKRPKDFKRRILQKTNDRKILIEMEYKWLSLIPKKQLGVRYYNHSNRRFTHWSHSNNRDDVCKKLSAALIGNSRHTVPHTEQSKLKIRKSLTMSAKQKSKFTDEVRQKIRAARARRTPEDFQKIKDGLKKVPKIKCTYCSNLVDPGNYNKHHRDNCKYKVLTSNWVA